MISQVPGEVLNELQQVLTLLGRDGVKIEAQQACRRVVGIDLEQVFVVLESRPVAPFLAQDVDEGEQRHEQPLRRRIVHDLFLHQVLFDKLLGDVACHLVDIDHLLNQSV